MDDTHHNANGKPPAGGWTWVTDEDVLTLANLHPSCAVVYLRLKKYADAEGHCFPKVDTLADELGISKRLIITLIKLL